MAKTKAVVKVKKKFDASAQEVFDAWLDPKIAGKWLFATPAGKMLEVKIDAHEGGAWKIVEQRGDEKAEHRGKYLEINRPKKLVFTFGVPGYPSTKVSINIKSLKAGCELTLTHEGVLKEYKAKTQEGWATLLDGLGQNVPTREIVLSRVINAPRERVWEAMKDPKQVVQWWGPKGFTDRTHIMDVRVGGVWKHTMIGPDGAEYPNKSIFKEIVKPKRIVYALAGGRKGGTRGAHFTATWTFEKTDDNKTKVTIRMVVPTIEERNFIVKEFGAIEGGKQTLGKLDEYLAKEPVIIERTFNALAERVWKAITVKKEMKQWYFGNLKEFKPEVGFKTEVTTRHEGKTYPHLWKVTEVIVGKKITYSWKYAGKPGKSILTMELTPQGKKTKFKLTHEGLETFLPQENPELARGNFVQGWKYFIEEALTKYLKTNRKS